MKKTIPSQTTPVKHDVLIEIFAKGRLRYDEMRVAAFIIRWSWGFHKNGTQKHFTITDIAKAIGMDRGNCSKTINRMIKEKKLIKNDGGDLEFNEHFEEWERVKNTHPKTVSNLHGERVKNTRGACEKYTGSVCNLHGQAPTNTDKIKSAETPKEIYKENIKKYIKKESIEKEKPKSKNQLLKEKIRYNEQEGRFEYFPEELISYFQEKYPNLDVKNVLKTMEAWIFTKFILKGKHSPYKDYAAALARWLAKEEKEQKQRKGGIIDYVTKGVSRYVGITKSEERNKKFKDEFIP